MSYNNSNFHNNMPLNAFQGRPRNFGPHTANFRPPRNNNGHPPRNYDPNLNNYGPPPGHYGPPPNIYGPPPSYGPSSDFIPPPPAPPPFFIPILHTPSISDQDFIKQFEKPTTKPKSEPTNISINAVKENLRNLVLTLNKLKEKEKYLKENINAMPEEDWSLELMKIKDNKSEINNTLSQINDSYLDALRKLITKRSAKRLRLKRLREERKKEKEELIKERQEKSRKIDENLQKIKDEIDKVKQEEQAKLEADNVLKEVRRKKHDAKKCITKLEAMLKMYRARQNTAKGRGELASERNAENFNSNIEKLKAVWSHKLKLYDKEEAELLAKLKESNKVQHSCIKYETLNNLDKWREFLFGGSAGPQVDFKGDLGRFIAVRSQWDEYISKEGGSLPVGWVAPNLTT